MRLFLIDPHEGRYYNNRMFDISKFPTSSIWKNIKDYLLTKDVVIDTIDRHSLTEADKIFFIDHQSFSFLSDKHYYLDLCIRQNIPLKKMNLIIFECPIIKPNNWSHINHVYYSRIFTWSDELVDNDKYHHFRWPQTLDGINSPMVPYSKKKLVTLVNANKANYLPGELYSLRRRIIRYFEKNHSTEFDLYGIGWGEPLQIKFAYSLHYNKKLNLLKFFFDYLSSHKTYSSYRGTIDSKHLTLSGYKFSICFENMTNINGYITEKIFDCFKAGCIPVYYGAKNIDNYIPESTFIDFRNFSNFDSLYNFLASMKKDTYDEIIRLEQKFLKNQMNKWDYISFANSVFLKH